MMMTDEKTSQPTLWNHGRSVTIHECAQKDKDAGHHWFDADTMRFFGTRMSEITHPCKWGLFMACHRASPDGRNPWAIHQTLPSGETESVHDLTDGHLSRDEAAQLLKDIRADLKLIESDWPSILEQIQTHSPTDQGHFSNTYCCSGPEREHAGQTELYWFDVSRMTVADGAACDHAISYKGVVIARDSNA